MTFKFNGIVIDNRNGTVTYNGNELDVLKLNGVTVWEKITNKGVTIYGACQINNNIISNFNTSSYAVPNYNFRPIYGLDSFEIQFKITTGTLNTTPQYLYQSYNSTNSSLNYLPKLDFLIQSNGIGFNANDETSQYVTFSTSTSVLSNTTYYIKVTHDGYLSLSLYFQTSEIDENSTPINTITITRFPNLTNCDTFCIGETNNSYYQNFGNPFSGTIDLNNCFIKLNNQLVWKGA